MSRVNKEINTQEGLNALLEKIMASSGQCEVIAHAMTKYHGLKEIHQTVKLRINGLGVVEIRLEQSSDKVDVRAVS